MHYPVHLYPHLDKLHRPLTQDSFAWLCHLSHALLLCSGAACWVVAEKASSVGKVRKPCCLRLLDEIVFFEFLPRVFPKETSDNFGGIAFHLLGGPSTYKFNISLNIPQLTIAILYSMVVRYIKHDSG